MTNVDAAIDIVVPPRMSRIERLMADLESGPSVLSVRASLSSNDVECDERNARVFRNARQLILDLLGMSEKPLGEQIYAACLKKCDEASASEGDPDDLRTMTRFAKRWLPDCYPASEAGQVHFARAVCESLVAAAEAHLRRLGQSVEA